MTAPSPSVVWLVNPFDNLPAEGRRAQRYWMMARAFAAAGWTAVLWTSDFSHADKAPRRMAPQEPLRDPSGGSVALRLVPTLPYARNVSFARLRSHRRLAADWLGLARRERVQPALVVASVPPLALADAARRYARETGGRFIADVQDAWPETFYRLLPPGLRWTGPLAFAPFRAAARRIYRGADAVTGVCDRYAALVRGYGARAYRRFYLGIDVPPPVARALRTPGVTRLVYAGNLGRGYDLATLERAVASDPSLTLDVAGPCAPCARGRVTFHGYLGDADLRALLARCDVGVIPMRDDSFVGLPNKLADYAAAGLPVVSSLGGECAALLARHGAGVVYTPGDAASLAASVRAALACAPDAPFRLLAELDAARIYPAYVAFVSATDTRS